MTKSLIVSSTFASLLALIAFGGNANADGISVHASGSVSVRAGVHLNFGAATELLEEAGQVLDHIRFAVPPASVRVRIGPRPIPRSYPPPCRFRCAAVVPSYYVSQPVVRTQYLPPLAPVVVAPRVSRWSLGAFAGSIDVDGQPESMPDLGIMGQFRLSPAFTLEAELSRSERTEIARVDRRIGASILYDFSPYSTLSPFVLAGAGVSQTDINEGAFLADQGYGEVGLGARLRLGHRFQLIADVRVGARETQDDAVFKSTSPVMPVQQEEQYARFRLGGLVNF